MPIYMTARFAVQEGKLPVCEQAIREFVAYVRENEPNTFLYTSLQDKENPYRFFFITSSSKTKARGNYIQARTP